MVYWPTYKDEHPPTPKQEQEQREERKKQIGRMLRGLVNTMSKRTIIEELTDAGWDHLEIVEIFEYAYESQNS